MKRITSILLSAITVMGTLGFVGCTPKEETQAPAVQIYMPDGAPALSMAKFMANDTDSDGKEYHVVEAGTINAYITGRDPKADLCVLPLNAASKLLGSGESYQMLGTVTHGNLYLISTDDSVTFYEKSDLNSLLGKKVGVIQIANVPGLTFKVILNQNNLEWRELTGNNEQSGTAVNLQGIADPATGVSPAGGCDYYVAAEPLVSAKIAGTASSSKPLKMVGDLQALYGEGGYPQAVLVAKTSFIRSNEKWIADFMGEMSSAAEWLKESEALAVVQAVASHLPEGQTPTFSAKNLSAEVISRCGIYFSPASACKEEVVQFLAQLSAVNPAAVFAVTDRFFYGV